MCLKSSSLPRAGRMREAMREALPHGFGHLRLLVAARLVDRLAPPLTP
ncbi:MAG: hypothetical protein M3430_07565 [Acidobacteriota bacterium]|nr:hypothetical protein [Acidobacteriota bacterium]